MTGSGKERGWYPDPAGAGNRLRWWDGSAWTEDYRADGSDVFPEAARTRTMERGSAPPPVLFQAVEPDRAKRRVVTGVAALALVAVSVAGGYFWGAHGKGSDGAAAAPSGAASAAPTAGNLPSAGGSSSGSPGSAAPAAPSAPVTAGLVGWWKLDDKSGGTAADSGGAHPATVLGDVAWSPEHGGSAVFAGKGNLAAGGPVLDTTKSFTVTAWAKLADTGNYATVVGQDGGQVSGFYLHFNKYANTWAFVRTSNDAANPASWFTVTAQAPPQVGVWTHLAGVYDAATSRMSLYVNGTLQGELAYPTPWKAQGSFAIGRATSGVDQFRGAIADVQAFDRVLTAAEIRTIATAPVS